MADQGTITPEESRKIHEKIQSNFAEKMEAGGISDERLIGLLKEELSATEIKVFHKEGEVFYSRPMIAHEPRLRALDLSLKLKGHLIDKHKVTVDASLTPILTEDQEIEVQAIMRVLKAKDREPVGNTVGNEKVLIDKWP